MIMVKLITPKTRIATIYADALIDYKNDNLTSARNKLQPLLNSDPNNTWFIDLMTDIDLATNNNAVAIDRILKALKSNPQSHSLQINLANCYIQDKQNVKAISLLHRYTLQNSQDIVGWELLESAYKGQRQRAQEMSSRAEILALQGQFDQAIRLLQNAKNISQNNKNNSSAVNNWT